MLSIFLLLPGKPEPSRVAHAELRRTTTAAYLGSAPRRSALRTNRWVLAPKDN